LVVARADDPRTARTEMDQAMDRLLDGLRANR
jgi:hypothetical protein